MNEAKEWLEPFGYSVHSYSADKTLISFSNIEEDYMPSITCTIDSGNKTVELQGGKGLKLFIALQTPPLMFKHPDIKKFIRAIQYYTQICATRPPF